MATAPRPVHRTILVVDVEGFTDHRRTTPHQVAVRETVYRALRRGFAECGVSWDGLYHEDRGDGALVLIPPEVPKSLLVAVLPHGLTAALREYNAGQPVEARVRLRAALHAGEVVQDPHGYVGAALNHVFRLLDLEQLKSALKDSPGVLALMASEWYYAEVVRNDPHSQSATYRLVRGAVKGSDLRGWVSLPDHPYPSRAHDGDEGGAKPLAPEASGPRQLPARASHFIGRTGELAQLTDFLDESSGQVGETPVLLITGTPGVGKTALAVNFAHRVRDRFPDGQLYVDLRGHDGSPAVTPKLVLDDFLGALGVPADRFPDGVEAQAALFRTVVTGRRLLVVLDNAGGADQVRPLLPGSSGCLVLVTSRSRLSGLVAREGAHRIPLVRLPEDEAAALLRRIIGSPRADAEPAEVARLARHCAYLPLALRIAAERVVTRPHITVADAVAELAAGSGQLDFLAADDDDGTAIRTVFSWSYQALSPEVARMFRLLGLHAGTSFGRRVAAVLAEVAPGEARRLLDALASAHLLEETSRDRYQLHDLLRAYAAERAAAEDGEGDRHKAVHRMLSWYLTTADAADGLLLQQRKYRLELGLSAAPCPATTFSDHQEALDWCEEERANLIAAIRQAAECGHHTMAWMIPGVLCAFFDLRKHWADRITALRLGLTSAEQAGDRRGEALMLLNLGVAYRDLRRFDSALACLTRALDICRDSGASWLEGAVLHKLGDTNRRMCRFDQAFGFLRQALRISRETGEQWGEGRVLTAFGDTYRDLAAFDDALAHYRAALTIWRENEHDADEGITLTSSGEVYRRLRRFDEAAECLNTSLLIARRLGNRHGEGETLKALGDLQRDLGRVDAARAFWRESTDIFEDLDDPQAGEVRERLKC